MVVGIKCCTASLVGVGLRAAFFRGSGDDGRDQQLLAPARLPQPVLFLAGNGAALVLLDHCPGHLFDHHLA